MGLDSTQGLGVNESREPGLSHAQACEQGGKSSLSGVDGTML
jgi:hypothetical protein